MNEAFHNEAFREVERAAVGLTVNHILVVDDNPSIHDDFRRIFSSSDAGASDALAAALLGPGRERPEESTASVEFHVDYAFQGKQALELVVEARARSRPYALVYMDVRMPPGWNGFESASRVLEEDPDVQIVLCTAYNDYGWEQRVEQLPARDRVLILKKPFDVIEVQQLANALCEKWRFARRDRERMLALERTVQELAVANAHLRQEIAERARTQDALRKAQRLEGLGRLAAGVCHEINNPLCFIVTSAEAMQDEFEDLSDVIPPATLDDINELNSAITAGAERIAQIVRNIRIFARQSEAPAELVDVGEAVASAVAMAKQHLAPSVELLVGPIDDAPVAGRRIELEQVLINLLENASHATAGLDAGSGRIAISSRREADGFVSIDVNDTGSGIDPDTLEKIFDPFFTTKPVNKGTGLGLSICHSLVQGMSGTIEVRSRPGSGTTFSVRLPTVPAAVSPGIEPPPRAREPVPVPQVRARARILVIDDEPFVLAAIQRILRDYTVTAVSTARDGLTACARDSFDLILCDMMMPSINGSDFYRMLQQMSPGAEERIVFITGGSFIDGIREFLEAVPNRCVEKPFESGLRNIVAEELARRTTTLAEAR
ncbi:MAG: response regulator [Myxococcota bacterium]